jgi:hypothetical protein
MRITRPLFLTLLSLFAALVTLSAVVEVEMALAFPWGPRNGLTGAPGESNCTACHASFPLDSGAGSFAESCATGDGEYIPGDTYTICLDLADPAASRWGFEITLIDAAGAKAGVLAPLDAQTQVADSLIAGDLRQYGKHTLSGTSPGTLVGKSWTMEWQAPAAGTGAVTLYGMGNAANNSGTILGDRIYSLVVPLTEASPTAVPLAPLAAALAPNFPNPFNPTTRLAFELGQPATVRLSIIDSAGRLVKVVHAGPVGAGAHDFAWDGRNAQGEPSASGIYFARLQDAAGHDLDAPAKMTLVK